MSSDNLDKPLWLVSDNIPFRDVKGGSDEED